VDWDKLREWLLNRLEERVHCEYFNKIRMKNKKTLELLNKSIKDWIYSIGYTICSFDSYYLLSDSKKTDWISIKKGEGNSKDTYAILICSYRRINLIEEYWEDLMMDDLNFWRGIKSTIGIEPEETINGIRQYTTRLVLPLDEPNGINKMIAFITDKYENVLLPQMKEQSNIHILDKMMNYDQTGSFSFFKGLVIAKLAGNPDYKKLFQSRIDKMNQALKENPWEKEECLQNIWKLEQLYERMKDVKSLKNPNLI
jgi:hypothetical protein